MELGYWGIKGVVEPVRWLIGYIGAEVRFYTPKTVEEWYDQKIHEINFHFPTLPYLKDDKTTITDIHAIAYYVCYKTNRSDLLGMDYLEMTNCRQLEGVLTDVRREIYRVIFDPSVDHPDEWRRSTNPQSIIYQKLDYIEKFLKGKQFILGHLTLIDFQLAYHYELLSVVSQSLGLPNPVPEGMENIRKLSKRILDLPCTKGRGEVPYFPEGMVQFKLRTQKEANIW